MEKRESKLKIYLLMVLLAVIWGLSFVVCKIALEELSVIEVLAVRWPIAGVCFLILGKLGLVKVNFKDKPKKGLFLICLCQPCLYAIFETIGTNITTSTECSVIIAMVPIMVIILSSLFFKMKNSRKAVFGILIAFVGLLFTVCLSPSFSLGGKGLGYLSLFAAVVVGALYCLFANMGGADYTPLEMAYAMGVSGGAWFFVLSLIMGNGLHPYKVLLAGTPATWALLYLGLLCSLLAYFIYNMSLVRMSAAIASCINTNLINIVGIIGGIVINGDPFGWYTVVGVILMVVGIAVTSLNNET